MRPCVLDRRAESGMHHAGDMSVYPRSGLLRHGSRLYSWRHLALSTGFWRDFIEMCPELVLHKRRIDVDPVDRDYFWTIFRIDPVPGLARMVHVSPTWKGVFPVVYVWRIQRAVKGFLRRRHEERALALAMCWHARLGAGSIMACLGEDILAVITRH